MSKIKGWISANIVVLFFSILCLFAYVIADQNPYVVVSDLVDRVVRNSILVLALIIPILTGMGLNFGIVVGAMSAQAAIIFITHWRMTGAVGIVTALAISTVISVICGFLLGRLFNKTRGQEMITGMIAGYFGQGIYLLIFLVIIGTIIPFWDPDLSISTGIGVKDTLNMVDGMSGAMDDALELPLAVLLVFSYAVYTVYAVYRVVKGRKGGRPVNIMSAALKWAVFGGILIALFVIEDCAFVINRCDVPVVTLIFILLVSALCQYITKTKLGQDFRSVGSNAHIAESAGIDIDKIRIIATIFSTVLASWGQFVFLQNMGTFSTYTAQTNVGTFSIAALLVGGATIDKANVKQAFIGVVLFQLLFLLSPAAGTAIFHDSQVGEYFRTVISYGVIAVALVLHAMNKTGKPKKA